MRVLLPLLFACASLVGQEPPAQKPAVEVGKPAPGFRLNDETGTAVKVGGPARSWTVLAFYPKAATPG